MTERDLTSQVLQLARLRGWRSAHFLPARTSSGGWHTAVQGDGVGFPDLVLVRKGVVIVAELKVGKNRPTPEQTAWLEAFRQAGVMAYLWTERHWSEIERVLDSGPG